MHILITNSPTANYALDKSRVFALIFDLGPAHGAPKCTSLEDVETTRESNAC